MDSSTAALLQAAYQETLDFASGIYVSKEMVTKYLTTDTDVYTLINGRIERDVNFCAMGFRDVVEVLKLSLLNTMLSANIVSRRGHEEVIDFLNSVFTAKTEEGPNLLRVRLFDVAMYFAKQVRIKVGGAFPDQFYPTNEEMFDFDKVALIYATEIIPGVFDEQLQTKAFPGVNVSLYSPPSPDVMSYAEYPWLLFFYQMVLDLK